MKLSDFVISNVFPAFWRHLFSEYLMLSSELMVYFFPYFIVLAANQNLLSNLLSVLMSKA